MAALTQSYDPAFPVDQLVEHPDNPRRGDEAAIEASMVAHGFYGAVLVQASTRRIIAGNHRTRVARHLGESTVPVLFVDVDDERARRLLLVDNRTNDVAGYDSGELARLLEELSTLDNGLVGTGFTDSDLDALLAGLEDADPNMPVRGDERYTPQWIFDGMDLMFDVDVAAPVDPELRTTPARSHLCIHDDGLAAPWEGLVWMNPPYSVAAAWARRWLRHPDGVCLIVVSNSIWVPDLAEAADLFVFVPNLTFTTPIEQEGAISTITFMAARGAGTPGLERLAELHNWPTMRATPRPRPDEPLLF